MKTRSPFLTLLFILLLPLCSAAQTNAPEPFTAFIVTDTHVSNDETKDDRLRAFVEMVNTGSYADVDIVLHTGDLVSSVYLADKEYTAQNSRLVKGYAIFSGLEVPFIPVMGNHDYKIDNDRDSDDPFEMDEILQLEDIWKEVSGLEPYYSYTFRGWNIIALNSMRGRPSERDFDDEQVEWYEKELEKGLPAIVIFHHPIKTDDEEITWSRKYRDLTTPEIEPRFYEITKKHKENIHGIFFGHGHIWESDTLFETIPVRETASFADWGGIPFLKVEFICPGTSPVIEEVHLKTNN